MPPSRAATTSGTVSFETTGTPFLYDAWTGAVTSLPVYQQSPTHTTLQLELAGNQSLIIGFQSAAPSPPTTGGQIPLRATKPVVPIAAETVTLANWTLTVESWTPQADIYDVDAGAVRTNSTSPYTLPALLPWSQISDALQTVSGRGYYRATFAWPPSASSAASGAVVDLGSVFHTARLSVNGRVVPPLDPTWARADVGGLLVNGTNVVEVVVSTPLGNAVRGVWDLLDCSGKKADFNGNVPPPVAEYGLLGDVLVIPYA